MVGVPPRLQMSMEACAGYGLKIGYIPGIETRTAQSIVKPSVSNNPITHEETRIYFLYEIDRKFTHLTPRPLSVYKLGLCFEDTTVLRFFVKIRSSG